MAEEQSSWSTLAKVLTGLAGLVTAIVTFYTTVYKPDTHSKESPATVVVLPAAGSASSITPSPTTSAATTPVETKPATPNMVGGWQVHGNFQNGAPYAGRLNSQPTPISRWARRGSQPRRVRGDGNVLHATWLWMVSTTSMVTRCNFAACWAALPKEAMHGQDRVRIRPEWALSS
jgi:hypothetical protein